MGILEFEILPETEPCLYPKKESAKPKREFLIVEGEKMYCGGHKDYSGEWDCSYHTPINCEDCVFVVGVEMGDMRLGKRPFAKCNYD